MDNFLIIGNGFDLYHHYPTRYTDFLFFVNHWDDFLTENANAKLEVKPGEYLDISLSDKGELTANSIKDFAKYKNAYSKDNIDLFKINKLNHWIDYFNVLLDDKIIGEKWIDFEEEIMNVLSYIDEYFSVISTLKYLDIINYHLSNRTIKFISIFNKDEKPEFILKIGAKDFSFDALELKEQKKRFVNHVLEDLNRLIICINVYMLEFVSSIKCRYYSHQISELCISSYIYLLNFNYTDTFKCIYDKRKIKYIHSVHGNARENNIVLGVPDDSFEDTEYVYFQKYFQRIQKKTGSFYKDWISDVFKPTPSNLTTSSDYSRVYIFGHSLAETDKGILKDFFNNEHIREIVIFYHNQSAYEEMVINLIKVFGKDFVIKNTGSGRVCFKQLEEPIKL